MNRLTFFSFACLLTVACNTPQPKVESDVERKDSIVISYTDSLDRITPRAFGSSYGELAGHNYNVNGRKFFVFNVDNSRTDTVFEFKSRLLDKRYYVEPQEVQQPKHLDFSTCRYKKMFITVTRQGLEREGLNFAGHYSLVQWGCGSPCQQSAIIDMKTGKVYAGPGASLGYTFRKDSKIIVTNPAGEKDGNGQYLASIPYSKPEEYLWQNNKLIKLKEQ